MSSIKGNLSAFKTARNTSKQGSAELQLIDEATEGCENPDMEKFRVLTRRMENITDKNALYELVRRMRKKLKAYDHSTVMNTLFLIDILMDESHSEFHMAMTHRKMLNQLCKVVDLVKSGDKAREQESEKCLEMIGKWSHRFRHQLAIGRPFVDTQHILEKKGYVFPKAETSSAPRESARPHLSGSPTERRQIVGNVTRMLQEMITSASSPKDVQENEVIVQLTDQCRGFQRELAALLSTEEDSSKLDELLSLNEQVLQAIQMFDKTTGGEAPSTSTAPIHRGAPNRNTSRETSEGERRPSFDLESFIMQSTGGDNHASGDTRSVASDSSADSFDIVIPGNESPGHHNIETSMQNLQLHGQSNAPAPTYTSAATSAEHTGWGKVQAPPPLAPVMNQHYQGQYTLPPHAAPPANWPLGGLTSSWSQNQQQQQQQQQQQEAAADALQMAMMTMGNRQMPQGMPGLGVHAPNDALSGGGQQVGPGGVLPGMANSGLVARQLGVDDALAYLDKVKRQFNDKIDVYNRFLDIMKNFKAQTIDTPGVISHVCELFKGYDNLILGFNTFLPPGFKIELPNSEIGPMVGGQPVLTLAQQQELVERQVQHQQQQQQQMQMQQQRKIAGRGRGGAGPRPQGGPGNMNKGMQLPGAGRGGVMMGMMGDGRLNNGTMQMNMMDDATQANNQGQPVEFDHAIKYVTKIKKRFSAEADTYKTFLDILHSYQNEQRTIKEVLEQVSTLFKDHADLLKEFTYFLPDGVRESAKTELAKHAAKAQKASRMKANKSKKAGTPFSDLDHEESKVPQLERNLLGRIKAALGTRELWGEFLKCLDLFAQELISRGELLTLINDIFGERADLLEEFDRLLAVRGATDDPVESAWFSMPLTDIDFANCRRCTPSYRALPAAYPKAPCSERTAMCRSVLNDTWVSVPLGSEDSSSKGHRRNPFQDALFKCEDDRYEIDLIIDSGKAAIRALEPLAREIEALGLSNGEAAKFRYRLEKRTLSVIHLKAIARIYGDHGTEVLELLRRNPAGAIPVILKRLKEKDEEWCRDRHELNKSWKETMYRNYSKSLDHRSTHFKHMEKRCFTQKVLLAEIREKKSARTAAAAAASPDQATSDDDLIKLPLEDPSIHRDCWSLVGLKVEKTSHDSVEADRVAAFLAYFCHSFFNMPDNWLAPGKSLMATVSSKSMTEDSGSPKTREDAFPDDTKVETPYGSGTVKSFDVARGFYEIQLVYGVGFMRHNVVKLAASKDLPKTKQAVPAPLEDPEAVKQAKSNIGKEPVNFYSSIAVYVFMRQYQLLCQRLSDAKALCRNSPQPRRVKHVIDEAHEKEEASNAMEINEEGGDGEGDNDSDQAKERAAEARYAKLLSLIFALVGGSLESSKFEEETRTLLGPKIFFLYTIDKLVIAIQKQLVSIVNDEKGADVLERARSLCDKDSEGTALELSKIYQGTLSHLQLTDSSFLRLRYIPGTLKTEQEMQEAANAPGEPPLPEGHIVNVEKPVISEWKVPPTLGLSLVSKIPILESLTESDSPKTVPALCPLEVDFAPTLELSGVIDLKGSELRKVQSAPAKPATRMVLPIYKEVDLPVSDSALSVIKKTCASIESAGEEADKKTKSSAWYVQPLEDAMELAEASPAPAEAATVDSGTAASETAASNADDVEMKDANP